MINSKFGLFYSLIYIDIEMFLARLYVTIYEINQLWMILITFVYLLTFVGIFDESTLLINRMGNIVFSEFFCKKKQDFYLLESNFQRVKHSARSLKAFEEY